MKFEDAETKYNKNYMPYDIDPEEEEEEDDDGYVGEGEL